MTLQKFTKIFLISFTPFHKSIIIFIRSEIFMKKNRKKKPIRFKKFFTIFSCVLFLATIILGIYVVRLNVLELKFIGAILCVFLLVDVILTLIYLKHYKISKKIPFIIIGVLMLLGEVFGTYNISKTIDFVEKISGTNIRKEAFNIYVLNSSKYETLEDLKNSTLGIYDSKSDYLNDALDNLRKKVENFKSEKRYDDITDTLNAGINKKVDALFVSSTMEEIMNEEYPELKSQFRILDTITLSYKEMIKKNQVDVTKDAFIVYISGNDTYGSIGTVSRSDVNIIAVINPKTNKILLVNTPRDYYVMLHSKKAMDKLTHAGIYGTDESAKTLGLLYDTEVNYYVRINFTSFIQIIDALGGIEVTVDKPDYRYNGSIDCGSGYVCEQNSNRKWDSNTVYLKVGKQTLNGEQALAYARNRHQYASGDLARGVHQQQIIKAIIEKAMSSNILTKYNTILKTLSKGIITNIEQKTITKLVNNQLDKNIKWEIETYSVTGKSSYEVTYSLGKAKAYVLIPDEESINEAKNRIHEIMENSYLK